MNKIYITGKSVFTNRPLKIGITDGIICSVEEGEDTQNIISPGFMDLQINGYSSKDYSTDLSIAQIEKLAYEITKCGTTNHYATIITNSELRITASIRNIVNARKSSTLVENAISGLHIEGPFISPAEGARGVHDPDYIRKADYDEFLRWQEAAEGLIRIVTISPEDENSIEFIKRVSESGVIVSIGHTAATPEMIGRAIDAGASLSTHLGNGSTDLIPRFKNNIWKQLSEERLYTSIIADGFHVPSYVLKCYLKCKGLDKTILVSDAAALAGSKPGLYKWGKMDIEIFEDGHMGLHNTQSLAGALYMLGTCISYLTQNTQYSLQDIIKCATVNPRKLTDSNCWESEPVIGEKANLTSFTMVNGAINITKTVCFNTVVENINKEI